jgi:hypothetical protein
LEATLLADLWTAGLLKTSMMSGAVPGLMFLLSERTGQYCIILPFQIIPVKDVAVDQLRQGAGVMRYVMARVIVALINVNFASVPFASNAS